jgi:hypothetical protein
VVQRAPPQAAQRELRAEERERPVPAARHELLVEARRAPPAAGHEKPVAATADGWPQRVVLEAGTQQAAVKAAG